MDGMWMVIDWPSSIYRIRTSGVLGSMIRKVIKECPNPECKNGFVKHQTPTGKWEWWKCPTCNGTQRVEVEYDDRKP
jgi:hypothetical protein